MCYLLLLNLEYVLLGTFDPLTFPRDACTFFRIFRVFVHEAWNPIDLFF